MVLPCGKKVFMSGDIAPQQRLKDLGVLSTHENLAMYYYQDNNQINILNEHCWQSFLKFAEKSSSTYSVYLESSPSQPPTVVVVPPPPS